MALRALLKRNTYYDSISLMTLAQAIKDLPGVEDAGAVMATELNCELLRDSNLLPTAFLAEQETPPGPSDLLIVVRAIDEVRAAAALTVVEERLAARISGVASTARVAYEPPTARSLEVALRRDSQANLALIAVAGQHAWLEAEQALRRGLRVFLFSDNVPIEREQALKDLAMQRALLLMGPDCGTAILDGVGLGFANVVPRGPIGIVGASGTGIQQIACLIAAAGLGISQAIGTGSRDLSAAIGGAMTRRGLALLASDPQTQVVVLVSKPPAAQVAQEILAAARIGKPVVVVFLGADPRQLAPALGTARWAQTLTEGAALAVALAGGDSERVPGYREMAAAGKHAHEHIGSRPPATESQGSLPRRKMADAGAFIRPPRYVRALYSGGTLCDEAMLLLSERLGTVASNIPLRPEWALAPGETFRGHTALDLGADEFTRGRPHPMIDPALRLSYLARAAADPETAVILLDIVLGFCAHQNPAAVYAPAIAQAQATAAAAGRSLSVVIALCGTEGDPQRFSSQRAALEAAGARVFVSNAAAALAAAALIDGGTADPIPLPDDSRQTPPQDSSESAQPDASLSDSRNRSSPLSPPFLHWERRGGRSRPPARHHYWRRSLRRSAGHPGCARDARHLAARCWQHR